MREALVFLRDILRLAIALRSHVLRFTLRPLLVGVGSWWPLV